MSKEITLSPFPNDYVSKKEKANPTHGLAVSDACLSRYSNGLAVWGNTAISEFNIMALYLRSQQPSEQYRKRFHGENPDGTTKKGYVNVDQTVATPAPKYRSIIHSQLAQSDLMTEVTSLSKDAINKKTLAKHRHWYELKEGNEIRKKASERLGVEIPMKSHYWIPENKQDLEIYEKFGGFKLMEETAMMKMSEDMFNRSDWDGYIRPENIDRMLETSWMITKIIDKEDGSIGFEYIPVRDYVGAYTEKDTENPAWEGHYSYMSMEKVVRKLKVFYPNITNTEIENIAKANIGFNKGWSENNYRIPDPVTNRMPYYDFMVRVFNFVYQSIDVDGYTEKIKEDGSKSYFKEEDGKYYQDNKKKTDRYTNCTYYEGVRLVGLNYMLEWGPMQNVVKDEMGVPVSPYVRHTTREASLVSRWKPDLDNYQMVNLKYRNFIQNLKGDQTVYDVGIMAQLNLGGKMHPTEMVRFANETDSIIVQTRGDMLHNKVDPKGAMYNLQRGQNTGLVAVKMERDFLEMQLRQTAGITESIAATAHQSAEKGVGLGLQEIAAAGSAFYTFNRTLIRHKIELSKRGVAKYRVKMEFDPKTVEYLNGVIGQPYVRAVLDNVDITLAQMGITFKVKPTEERKIFIKQLILESIAAGKNGQAGINSSVAGVVEKLLEDGYYDLALAYMAMEEDRSARRIEANRAAATKETGEVQMASAKAAEEARTRAEQFLTQLRIQENGQEIANKLQADLVLQDKQHKDKMAEITLTETYSLQQKHLDINSNERRAS